ncbi:MAG: hypothetical protein IPK26_25975 [Planctomycetes bacterium]|nr:hypothetical protein [Planctomycetota bacterium]
MALTLIADSLDELPEAVRKDAAQANGKFALAVPAGWSVEDTKGLKKALQDERGARSKAEQALASFEGIDDAKAAREALEKLRAGGLKSAADIDAFKASLEKKFGEDRAKLEGQVKAYRGQLESELVERAAIAAITAKGGGKSLRALLPLVKQATRVEHLADGKLRVTLVNEDGSPIVTKRSGSTDPMGVDEYVEVLRDAPDLKPLFDATSAGGSGAHSQGGGSARAANNTNQPLTGYGLLQRANEQSAHA